MPVRPVVFELHIHRPGDVLGERFDLGAREPVVFLARGAAGFDVGGKRRAVDEFRGTFRVGDAGEKRLVQPVASLLRGLAAHAFAECNAQSGQIGIFIEHLGDHFARVADDEFIRRVRFLTDVTPILAPARDVVGAGELRRDESVPVDQIGLDAALLRQRKDPAPQFFPLRQLGSVERASLGKILRPDHVVERMKTPKREHVEAILRHHIEECLPELQIAARGIVLFDDRAGAVGRPRQIELDGAKLKRRLHRALLELVPGCAQADLLRQIEQAIHRTPLVTASDRPAIALPGLTEAFRSYAVRAPSAECDTQSRSPIWAGLRDPLERVAACAQRRLQFAQCETQQGGIGRGDRDFGGRERCTEQK